jgi:hypothetical protein
LETTLAPVMALLLQHGLLDGLLVCNHKNKIKHYQTS